MEFITVLRQALWFFFATALFNGYNAVLREKIISERAYAIANKIEGVIFFLIVMGIWSIQPENIGFIVHNIGIFCNMLVIVFNGGYMPVDMDAFKRSISSISMRPISDETVQMVFRTTQLARHHHVAMNENTRLKFLGDKYGPSVSSIGDIFIYIGFYMILVKFIVNLFGFTFFS